jgi:anti-anti-sigma factor
VSKPGGSEAISRTRRGPRNRPRLGLFRVLFLDCGEGEAALTIQDHRDGDRHTLRLEGELDMASAQELERRARQLCSENASELVLDLSQLEFMDSAGLNAILRVRTLCRERVCDFGLIPGTQPVQRLFEITRLTDSLPFRAPHHSEQSASPTADPSPQLRGADPDSGA